MLKNIPHQRLLLYILLLGLVPLIISGSLFFSALSNLDETRGSLEQVKQAAFLQEKKQAVNIALRNHYSDADHFYIDKHLENMAFLETELDNLTKINLNKNYAEDESLKKRLDFVSSGNAMVFTEGAVQTSPLFQETTETLVHPVEVNNNDLHQILARIEGVEMGTHLSPENRPQLLVLEFKLDRKSISEKNEVFLLNLKLLKREFL